MIKEIKFGGYTAKPSDYECPDGDLAITSNIVPDDGALRPIMPPKVIGDVQADERFVFIHENIGYKHYIVEGQEGTGGQKHIVLKWTDDKGLNTASAAPAPGSGATADTGRYGFHGQTQQDSDETEPLDTSTIPISEIQDEEGNRYPIRIIDDNAYGVWDGSDSELADNVNDSQPFIGAGHWLVTEYGQYIELADEDLGTIVDQTRFIAPGNGDAFIMREGAYLSTSEEIDYTDVSNHMYVHLDNEWIDLGVIRESQEDEGEGDGESEAKPDVDDEEDTPTPTEPTTIDIEFEVGETLRDITAVGNILIVASSLRMYYVLWRQNMTDYEDGYYLLGNEVPKVELEFALEGTIKSKTFSNVKLELEDDGYITPEDAWEVAKRYAYQFNNIQKLQYSNWVNINYSLEVNKEYCFKTEIDADNPWYQIQVEGKVNDVYQRVITLSPTKKRTYTIRSKGFTELRLRVQANARDVDYISNTLIIEKGAESDISISKPPKSDGKTFTALMSVMNTYTHAQQEEGKFIYPFFVRYAMCLYDGNYIQQSEPVLMLPSTGYVPFMEWDNQGKVTAHSFISDLQYSVRQQIPSGWEDIITKVDIFISPFCYPYKQGEEFSDSKTGQFEYKGVVYDANGKETVNTIRQEGYGHLHVVEQAVTTRYAKTSLFDFLRGYHDVALPVQSTTKGFVEICPVSMEERMTNLKNTSTYYKIASLSMDEIKTVDNENFTAIDIERGTLNNLVTLPTFKDNMLADRRLIVGDLHTYNNRLHVFGSTWRLPDAPSPRFLNQYNNSSYVSSIQHAALYVYCRTPQGTKIIKTNLNEVVKYKITYIPGTGNPPRYETHVIIPSASWFFYPDTSAYKAIIVADISNQGVSTKYKVELDLKQHDLLTGAYWLNDDINSDIELLQDSAWEEPPETGRDLLMPTSIYVSEADNPFVFRSQSVVNVGAQRVIELAAAARPLSQGQFGQFPLYAFTDEGVWALETTQTGSYIARQPFARDVLLSREAVTSLDDTVAFLSKRGLMMLAGRDAVCVSDILDNDVAVTEFSGIGNAPDNIKPFKEYIIGARILYDYTNQRLIVYSPTKDYAYVYSLRSKQWGMRISGLLYHLNSYPDALAVEMIDNDNKLVNLSKADENVTEGVSGTIITRPLKLDYPDALKTIDTLIVRGMFKLSDAPVKTILYGSRNLYDWVPVWSSNNQYLRGFRGTPYKFFRLVITCDLKEGESVSGCTVQYNPRYTNRLR